MLVYTPYALLKAAFLKFGWREKKTSYPALLVFVQVKKFPSRLLPNEKLVIPMRIWEEELSPFDVCFLGYIFTPSDQKVARRPISSWTSSSFLHNAATHPSAEDPSCSLACVVLWVSLCCPLVFREKLWCRAHPSAPLEGSGRRI